MIPEDWEVSTVGAEFSIKLGKMLDADKNSGEAKVYIGNRSVQWGQFDLEAVELIKLSPSDKKRYRLRKGDLLVCEGGEVGRAAIWDDELEECYYQKALHRLRSLRGFDAYLMLNLLEWLAKSNGFRDFVTQTSIAHLPKEKFELVPIPLPAKAEQQAIAEALSDADTLIESLEQLIAKKRQIKQGAVGELLSPKEGWTNKALGQIADPNQQWSFTGGPFGSNLKSTDYTKDGIRIIQLQNIGDGEFKNEFSVFTSAEKAKELISCNIYPGEIILSKMGDPVARACIVPSHSERYLMCSDGIRLAVDRKLYDPYFVFVMVNSPAFRVKAESASTGSTRKRIGISELRSLEFPCPSLDEQNQIALILCDMDKEIDELEVRLSKARQIKQGMMQELLTGSIRLV